MRRVALASSEQLGAPFIPASSRAAVLDLPPYECQIHAMPISNTPWQFRAHTVQCHGKRNSKGRWQSCPASTSMSKKHPVDSDHMRLCEPPICPSEDLQRSRNEKKARELHCFSKPLNFTALHRMTSAIAAEAGHTKRFRMCSNASNNTPKDLSNSKVQICMKIQSQMMCSCFDLTCDHHHCQQHHSSSKRCLGTQFVPAVTRVRMCLPATAFCSVWSGVGGPGIVNRAERSHEI